MLYVYAHRHGIQIVEVLPIFSMPSTKNFSILYDALHHIHITGTNVSKALRGDFNHRKQIQQNNQTTLEADFSI